MIEDDRRCLWHLFINIWYSRATAIVRHTYTTQMYHRFSFFRCLTSFPLLLNASFKNRTKIFHFIHLCVKPAGEWCAIYKRLNETQSTFRTQRLIVLCSFQLNAAGVEAIAVCLRKFPAFCLPFETFRVTLSVHHFMLTWSLSYS